MLTCRVTGTSLLYRSSLSFRDLRPTNWRIRKLNWVSPRHPGTWRNAGELWATHAVQHASSQSRLYLSTSPGRTGSRCCSSKPNNGEPPSVRWLFIRATCSSSIKSYLLLSELHILRVQQLKTKRTSFHSEVWHEQLHRTPCPHRVKALGQVFLFWSDQIWSARFQWAFHGLNCWYLQCLLIKA